MKSHKVLHKSITLPDGKIINVKYWAENGNIIVSGFDENDEQITSSFQAPAEDSDEFYNALNKTTIDALVESLVSSLKECPELHLVKNDIIEA